MRNVNSKVYKLRDSIDVYRISRPGVGRDIFLQFYKINTREKLTIRTKPEVAELLPSLDGKSTIQEVLDGLGFTANSTDIFRLFDFLTRKGYLVDADRKPGLPKFHSRYSRQIAYFDDLVPDMPGELAQRALSRSHVFISGVGAIGSAIAIQLARAGVNRLTLLDYKSLSESHQQRHVFYKRESLGKDKTEALREYIHSVDPSCDVTCVNRKIKPNTDLSAFVGDNVDLLVNSADEPYIGHLSVKFGRYLWPKNIAFYAAGGFDAHLCSTGELIAPGLTPCIDCYVGEFSRLLVNWEPEYLGAENSRSRVQSLNSAPVAPPVPLVGGLRGHSLLASNFAVMNIIDHLIGKHRSSRALARRGEFLPDRGSMTWVSLNHQKATCDVCGYK